MNSTKEFIRDISFPIYKGINKENADFIGTGFLVNNENYFVTAGHVFKDKANSNFFGVIDNRIFKLNCIFSEYEKLENNETKTHRDLIIGQIEELKGNNLEITFNCNTIDQLKTYAIQYQSGYLKNNFQPTLSRPISCNFYLDPLHPLNSNYDNTLLVPIPEQNNIIPGMSGGPIISNNTIIAIITNRSVCIKSEYLVMKLSDLDIKVQIKNS